MFAIALASLVLKSSLLLSVGLLAASVPRFSAAVRHLILFVTLVSTLALPLLVWSVPDMHVATLPVAVQTYLAHGTSDVQARDVLTSASSMLPDVLSMLTLVLFTTWAVGAVLALMRTARSWFALAAMLRRAQAAEDTEWLALLVACCARMSLRKPRLLFSGETDVAFACGWRQPAIVLPVEAREWPQARRRNVLLHELSHVERRDALTQLVAQVARALYFWNPLAIRIEERLREEREYACDDRALDCGVRPETYAATLVDVAESLVACNTTIAPAMAASASQLEERVCAVLDSHRRRDRAGVVKAAVVTSAAAVLLLPVAAMRAAERETAPRVELPSSVTTSPSEAVLISRSSGGSDAYGSFAFGSSSDAEGQVQQIVGSRASPERTAGKLLREAVPPH